MINKYIGAILFLMTLKMYCSDGKQCNVETCKLAKDFVSLQDLKRFNILVPHDKHNYMYRMYENAGKNWDVLIAELDESDLEEARQAFNLFKEGSFTSWQAKELSDRLATDDCFREQMKIICNRGSVTYLNMMSGLIRQKLDSRH